MNKIQRNDMVSTLSRRRFLSSTSKALCSIYASSVAFPSVVSCNARNKSSAKIGMQAPWINDAEFIGYFVAIENGYYKEEGINFEYFAGGPEIISDSVLLVKKVEIALTTPDVTINAIVKQKAPFKIIGAQYQKSPLGIVSLKKNQIVKPKDLIGKTIAVPPANQLTMDAFLNINGIHRKDLKIVPYQYDPTPLLNGDVDATLDFVTNVPFTIRERGGDPTSFLLYDYGFQIFNDTVVVNEETLKNRRKQLSAWLRASRRGWDENFNDMVKYPSIFIDSYFKETGRTKENEIFYNRAQKDLISPGAGTPLVNNTEKFEGVYSMTEENIKNNIRSLEAVGIKAERNMFVNDLI